MVSDLDIENANTFCLCNCGARSSSNSRSKDFVYFGKNGSVFRSERSLANLRISLDEVPTIELIISIVN